MAVSEKTLSALIEAQLPDFIRADHPKFQRFVELYYQWLENNNPSGISNTAGNTVYHAMNIDTYRDIDETPDEFIRYFKQEILPYFPENTALSTEKILKSAREYYSKKGSDESLKWLFRALFAEDIEVLYPKEEILIASDGKWAKPKAFRITVSESNKSVDVNLLEKRLIVGTESGATCVVESANRTIDKTNGKEIIEIYVSNVKQYFNNGERIRIDYVDQFGVERVFLERIIGTISNIRIDSNIKTDPTQRRRGLYYNIGDPVVMTGGLGITGDANDAVAIVGNVTLGSIESVTTRFPGYGYRLYSNTEVIVYRGVGDDPRANLFTDLQVTVLNQTDSSSNSQRDFLIPITYDRSVIDYMADTVISDTDYDVFTQNNRNVILNVTETDKDDFYANGEQIWANGTNFLDARFSGKVATPNNTLFGVGGVSANTGEILIYDVKLQGVDSVATALSGSQLQTKNTDKVFIVNSIVNDQVPANSQSQLIQCFDYVTENTGGIALISVINGGAGFRQAPALGIESHYDTQLSSLYSYEDEKELKKTHWQTFKDLGLIAQIRIVDGGRGYSVGDTISFDGRGYGGSAVVQSVGSGGRITSIAITDRGEGYLARPDLHVTRQSPTYTTLSGTANIQVGSNLVIGTGTAFAGSAAANNRQLIRVNNEIRRVVSVINNTHLYVNSEFKTTATDTTIEKQSGVEPVLIGYLFGDGVENIVNASAIGRIKDLRLIYRGYDYVATPNVSLKILDTVINPIPEANVFTETEYVYQGDSIANSTFRANVKSYNRETGVLRLYDYSGAFSNTTDLISANGVYCNSNVSMNVPAPEQYPPQVIADGLPNPMRYGNGLAKAKAFFANGLIEFNGFYLNTDGFVSADKVLQDGKIYHNFSYVIESEKNLVDYETTIRNIAHPAGMAMISKTLSRNDIERVTEYSSNVTAILSRNRTEGAAAATVAVANSRSNVVTGTFTTWDPDPNNVSLYANTRVNVGDLIIMDDDPDDIVVPEVLRLPISGVISKINSNTELEVYGDFVYRGQGLVSSNTIFLRILGASNTTGNQVMALPNSRYDGLYPGNLAPNPEQPVISQNNIIRVGSDVREVISVTNGTHFVVNSNFTSDSTIQALEVLSNTRLVVAGNTNTLSEIVRAGDNVSLNIVTANVYTAQTGTVEIFTNNGTVIGTNTLFDTQLMANDYIMVANQVRQVINISNATVLSVDSPYTSNASGVIYLKRATSQNARVNAVISNYIDINLAYYGNTTNAVYHVVPNLAGGGLKFKIVTLTGN
jgi:hypothetical protein